MVKKRPERRLKRLLNVVRLLTSDGLSTSQLQLPNYWEIHTRNLYFVGVFQKTIWEQEEKYPEPDQKDLR